VTGFVWRLLSVPVFMLICVPAFLAIVGYGISNGVKWLFTGRKFKRYTIDQVVEWVMQPVDYVWKKAKII
jgi:hypothetical protein